MGVLLLKIFKMQGVARRGRARLGKARRGRARQGNKNPIQGGNNMETKKHPAWKNAIEIILKRFDTKGYGIVFSDEEINEMLEIKKPEFGSYDSFQKFQLERMSQLESLKEVLLENSSLCLESLRGNGYILMHPDDQVQIVAKKFFKHARNKIKRATAVLINVNYELLSSDVKQKQLDMLGKTAFIKAAMNKRKLIKQA